MKHPNRTGLALREGRFVQEAAPFHLTEMEVVYDGERVSRLPDRRAQRQSDDHLPPPGPPAG